MSAVIGTAHVRIVVDAEEKLVDQIAKLQETRDQAKHYGEEPAFIHSLQIEIDNKYAEYYQLTKDN